MANFFFPLHFGVDLYFDFSKIKLAVYLDQIGA